MEYRTLGYAGLKVPVLSLGTGTFGGKGEMFQKWGSTDVKEATELVNLCLDAGLNLFDTADIYSAGAAEEILGKAIQGKRDQVLISTKATFPVDSTPNGRGSSRYHLIRALDASLKRLNTDYIDIYFMHGFDGITPIDEVLRTLDNFIQSGKIRYIGCSNFSGWQLMKALACSEKFGLNRYCVYQGYYSLIGREYEWELMPLCLDQKVGTMVWSPLGWGRLTGKIRRNQPLPFGRLSQGGAQGGPPVNEEQLYSIVDVLEGIAKETGKLISQIALNWLLQRPSVCNLVIGARNKEQLVQNLGAVGWQLSQEHIAQLDKVSSVQPIYPYWHQQGYDEICPKPVKW
ncbi:MAG: aldo/keto reductase [Proteobacteria bacterium]|nr:aldo/keto reductase [Pseudomonadota bacterium]